MDLAVILGSAILGLLVGLTGTGGGALMTPMLMLLVPIRPSVAISSDLVATAFMRPFGSAVHLRRGTVNLRLVAWMSAGSVPSAFLGTYFLHTLGNSAATEEDLRIALGLALLGSAAAMVLRCAIERHSQGRRDDPPQELVVRPLGTIAIGILGGFVVGLTSVGAGSLMVVLLRFLYPALRTNHLIGTDLTQATPLAISASLGQLLFGHVMLVLISSIVIGSIPAVLLGSLLSSRLPDRFLRPMITVAILATGFRYVGIGAIR